MGTKSDEQSAVGYRKPPRSTRFKKGRSGNPKGRPPRGSQDSDVLVLLRSALNESVTVQENGERKTITKAEAIVKQLVNKSASGDARAMQMLLAALRSIATPLDAADGERAGDKAGQMLMLERLTLEERLELRRLVAKAQGEPAETSAEVAEVVASSATGKQSGDEN